MSRKTPYNSDRRNFLRRALRFTTLGALGIAGGKIALKRRRLIKEGKCINRGVCSSCRVFDGCKLPQALSAKQAKIERING